MDAEQFLKSVPQDGEVWLQQFSISNPPVTADNDDVQFMYSVPKSKRKRKLSAPTTAELHNLTPSKTLRVDQETPTFLIPEPNQRRASAGIVQQLECCHIGPENDQVAPTRTGSLPAIAVAFTETHVQQSATSNIQPTTTSIHLVPSIPTPTCSWQDPPPESPSQGWRPISFSPANSAKRPKVDEHTRASNPNLANSSQPPQVSPKTLPQSVTLPLRDFATPSYLEMLGSANMQDMLSLTIPSTNLNVSCLDYSNSMPAGVETQYNRLHHGVRDTSPELPRPDNATQSTSQHQPIYTSKNTPFQQTLRSEIPAITSNSPTYIDQTACEESIPPYYPSNLPRIFCQKTHTPHTFNQSLSHRTSQAGTNNFFAPYVTAISDNGSFRQAPPSQRQTHGRAPPSPRLTQRADVLRRPSLYRIPPWPTFPISPLPILSPRQQARSRETAENYDLRRSEYEPRTEGPLAHDGSRVIYNRHEEPVVISESGFQGARGAAAELRDAIPQPEQSPPRKRARRREFSPNLIVDIAETLSALLPTEELAHRHNKTPQKVYDAFAAVIQIPLLRNAQDGRRHGELAKRRVREYREARKAMERERSGK